jgi:putative membrane protein
MTTKLMKQMGLTFALVAGSMSAAFAATSNDFVDTAAQSGITEVEAGKLALQKSSSADVKTFAQHMVDDHTKANQELMALAKKHDLEVPDDAALMDKAKKAILEMRDESFDKAYANNQVNAHEEAVELFKKESTSSDNAELKAFATEKLPTLEKHLQMAKELQSKYAK